MKSPSRFEVVGVGRYDQFKYADCIRVVIDKSIIRMLKSSLHLADVVGASSDIDIGVLGVLNAELIP